MTVRLVVLNKKKHHYMINKNSVFILNKKTYLQNFSYFGSMFFLAFSENRTMPGESASPAVLCD